MKKEHTVGILSMQRIINYGSFMQALGLKLLLNSIGVDAKFVDYHIGKWYSKQNIKNTCTYRKIRKAVSFIKPQKIDLEKDAITSQYDILKLDYKYHYRSKVDTLVIGSDEVFNYIQSGENVKYSPELIGMNNRAKRVITYAASCGNFNRKKLERYNKEEEFAKAMNRIDAISVRDDNTFNLIKEFTGIKPFMHLDPVLVADFGNLMQDNVEIDNYILVYGYTGRFTEEEGNVITKYAKRNGYKVYALGGQQKFCEKTIICKPLEVVSYFKHAAVIITDTFHGTIFSILAENNVAVVVRTGEEGNENKLKCLLKQLQIESKQVIHIEDIENVINHPMDYSNIRKIRERERERTLDYLKKQICE